MKERGRRNYSHFTSRMIVQFGHTIEILFPFLYFKYIIKRKENIKMGFIYKITNKINNKIYIGFTQKTIEDRWCSHIKNCL